MMKGIRNQQPIGATASRPLRARLYAAVRILLVGMILVAGWFVGRGFATLFADWRQLALPRTTSHPTLDFSTMAAVPPLAGPWSFAQLDWSVQTHLMAADHLERRFEAVAASPAPDAAMPLPDVPLELIELVELLRIEPTVRLGNHVYRLDRPNSKAQLVTRRIAGRRKLVALVAATPHDSQHWQLLELIPRGTSAQHDHAAHLLPLPAGSRRNGGRFDDIGRPLLELITLDSNAVELISTWSEAGWEVRPSGWGGPDDFSYLCAHGKEVVYAWSAGHRGALQHLMLVRTASDRD